MTEDMAIELGEIRKKGGFPITPFLSTANRLPLDLVRTVKDDGMVVTKYGWRSISHCPGPTRVASHPGVF